MAYVKIMIHAVWGTKNRERIMEKPQREKIITHTKEYARTKEIYIDTINAEPEHVHCLLGLNADMSIAKVMNLIKGESSHWINKQKLFNTKFEWADEYFAASVSESQLSKVRQYIKNQQEHHRIHTFEEEFKKFIDAYGIKIIQG